MWPQPQTEPRAMGVRGFLPSSASSRPKSTPRPLAHSQHEDGHTTALGTLGRRQQQSPSRRVTAQTDPASSPPSPSCSCRQTDGVTVWGPAVPADASGPSTSQDHRSPPATCPEGLDAYSCSLPASSGQILGASCSTPGSFSPST